MVQRVDRGPDDLGDILTPHERLAFDTSPAFAEIRARINADGWRDVWALRPIVTRGLPRTGPVAGLNLLAKRRATLMFNGYEQQVGQLYAGMDLKKNY